MSVERIYHDKIKSLEETISMIKNQVDFTSPSTHDIAIRNIRQILEQHEFVHNEIYKEKKQ